MSEGSRTRMGFSLTGVKCSATSHAREIFGQRTEDPFCRKDVPSPPTSATEETSKKKRKDATQKNRSERSGRRCGGKDVEAERRASVGMIL